jgi:hypothetical protein
MQALARTRPSGCATAPRAARALASSTRFTCSSGCGVRQGPQPGVAQ